MIWPFFAAGTAIALALTKLGALLVLVAILSASLKIVSILLIATVLAAGIYLMRQKYRKQ
jgi:hypothetical protein